MKQSIPISNSKSFDLLFGLFSDISQTSLWILDENPPEQCPKANKNIIVITNRFDTAQMMKEKGFTTFFSDFNFTELAFKEFEYIFYRISKEKALTHFIINQASTLLAEDGFFIFSGAKQEGIKGYIDRAKNIFNSIEQTKEDKDHWSAICSTPFIGQSLLDDKNYQQIRPIELKKQNNELISKPGVFGWNKIDSGSQLLIEQLPNLFHDRVKPRKALDIGCGYGYLSIYCANLLSCEMTACDNNAAAVNACTENFKKHKIKGKVIATNCTQNINDLFDLIICNPPFHSGFGVQNDLTILFLEGASKNLAPDGLAVFVVNLHIPLERKASVIFKNINTIYSDNHFKVITLQKR